MALAPTSIATSGIRMRTAALAMALTFAGGVATGLVVQRVASLSPLGQAGAVTAPWTAAEAEQAWLNYRAGERADLTATPWTPAQAEQAWLNYRAGERADPGAP